MRGRGPVWVGVGDMGVYVTEASPLASVVVSSCQRRGLGAVMVLLLESNSESLTPSIGLPSSPVTLKRMGNGVAIAAGGGAVGTGVVPRRGVAEGIGGAVWVLRGAEPVGIGGAVCAQRTRG